MLVGTLEALDRLPEGSNVLIEGDEWMRVKEGLQHDKETLPLLTFQAMAESGKIRTRGDLGLTFPSWRERNGNYYLLVGEDPITGGIGSIQVSTLGFGPYTEQSEATVRRWTATMAPDLAPSMGQWTALIAGLVKILRPVSFTGLMKGAGVSGTLLDDLHALAEKVEGLDEVLTNHQVGRVRTGEVEVKAEGTAKVTAEQFRAAGLQVDPVEVPWRFAYTYPATAPITESCLCGTFEEELFKARLPLNVSAFNYAVTCSDPKCVNK